MTLLNGVKITHLPPSLRLVGSEMLELVQGESSRKISVLELIKQGLLLGPVAEVIIDEALKDINDKIDEAIGKIEDAVDLDKLFRDQDDIAESILKLGRGQTELQSFVEAHTREDGVLVKSVVRVMGGEIENALAAIVEERSLRVEADQAEAIARLGLAVLVDDNRASAEQSISVLASDLAAEATARLNLGVRVGYAEAAISNEATVRATADAVFAQNFNLMGARRGNSSGWVLNQSTVDISGEGTFAEVLSGLRATDGANSSLIVTLQQTSSNQASQLTLLTGTVSGQTSSISQLFQVTDGLGSRWTMQLDSNGRITALVADGQTRSVQFMAASFAVIDDGNGLSYHPATGRLKIVKGTKKTVLGAGTGLILWAGDTSIADGAETVDNGDLGIGVGDAWFGGRTLSGPFDSGGSGGITHLTGSFQNIAEVTKTTRQGSFLLWPIFYHQGAGTPDGEGFADYSVDWQIVSTNSSGGDAQVLKSGFNVGQGGFGQTSWGPMLFAPPSDFNGIAHSKTGQRRIILQARLARGTQASLTNYAVCGFYAI